MAEPQMNQPGEPAGAQPVQNRTTRDGTLSTRAVGTLCKRCGYVLAGLPINGDCPECGLAVRTSLLGNRLEHAAPEWLGSVYKGLLLVSVLTFVAGPVAILSALHGDHFAVVIFSMVIALAQTLAWWSATRPEPDRPPDSEGFSARKLTRILVIAQFVSGTLHPLTSIVGVPGAAVPVGIAQLFAGRGILSVDALLTLSWLVAMAGSFFTASRYLRYLALRSFDKELASFIQMGQIFIPALLIFLTCVFGLGLLAAWGWWVATLIWCAATLRWVYKTRLAADEAAASRRTLQ